MMVVVSKSTRPPLTTEQHAVGGHPQLTPQDSVASIASMTNFNSSQLAPQGDAVEKLTFAMPRLKVKGSYYCPV